MTLVSELTEAFQRVGTEFKSVRSALTGKSDTGHTHPVTDLNTTGTPTASTYLNGTGAWSTPPNTTYSALTLAEAQTGTATTSRAITALVLKQAIWHYVTGGTASGLTAFGQSLTTAADAAAARTLLGATATGSSLFTAANAAAALSAIGAEASANKGAANGYAPLDGTSKVPAANLPAYVDDILEYANLAGFPGTGTSGLLYVALDTNKVYRWSGSAYTEVSASLALGTTSSTAKAGDWQPASTDITDSTATGRSLITAATAAAGRTTLGATTVGANLFTAADAAAARTAIVAEGAIAAGTSAQFWDGTKTWRAVGISDVTNLQVALDAKAPKASGMLGTGLPWYAQAVVNSSTLADGYNDLKGGLMADRDMVLESMVFWLEEPAGTIGGTGNLTIQWYAGSVTTQETTLIQTTTIAAGQHDIWVVLATPTNFAINTVFRPKITLGTTTVAGACHVQFRGRYQ